MVQPPSDNIQRAVDNPSASPEIVVGSAPPAQYPRARFLLIVLFLASVLAFLDRQLLNILIRPIREDIGLDDLSFSLLQGASFSLVYSLFTFPLAYLSDRQNRKTIVMAAIAIWTLMAFLFGLAHSFPMLVVSRMGLAMGEAALSPAAIAILRQAYPPHRQAFSVAVLTTSVYVGGGLSMIVGGPALHALQMHALDLPFGLHPWRVLVIACAALGIPVLALLTVMPEVRTTFEASVDISLSEFGRLLRKQLVDVAVFLVAFSGMTALLVVVMTWTPALFLRKFGWNEQQTGLYFGLAYTLAGITGGLGGGKIIQVLIKRGVENAAVKTCRVAVIAMGVGSVLLASAPNGEMGLAFASVAMLGVGCIIAVGSFAFQDLFPPAFSARAVAVYFLAAVTSGASIGPTAVPLIENMLGGQTKIAPAYAIFAGVAGVWSFIWATLFLRLARSRQRNSVEPADQLLSP
jgi:MFS family permease